MIVFVLTFVLLMIVIAIMSIGVMMGRKPIAGSCGGIKALGDGAVCEICGNDPNRCESEQEGKVVQKLADNADYYEERRT